MRSTSDSITVGSCFSGIGGFDLGLERAGMEVRWQIENDKWCNKILARHWPKVKRYDDITTVDPSELERVDLLCGGFPCQDLSVAGKRAGLDGSRSTLFWEFLRIADALRPRWLLIENVPGLFSSQSGRDFAQVIGGLDELGYGVAWRVLDSQNFGVPQRRRRVFIVGHLGAPCPPEVLFEPESLRRDTSSSSTTRQNVAPALRRRFDSSSRDGQDIASALRAERTIADSGGNQGNIIAPLGAGQGHNVSYALTGRGPGERREAESTYITGTVSGAEVHNGNSNSIAENYVVNARQTPIVGLPSLDAQGHSHAVGFGPTNRADGREWHELERARALNTFQSSMGASPALVSTPADPDGVFAPSRISRRLARLGGLIHADATEKYAAEVLRILWGTADSGEREGRGSTESPPLQSAEVLRSVMHEYGLPGEVSDRDAELVDRTLSCENPVEARSLLAVWLNEECGSPPYERKLERQRKGESSVAMSLLSYVRACLTTEPDSPRYRGLGNAVTVPVIKWVGRRIINAHMAH